MSGWAFWDLPLWHAYCEAYSGQWTDLRGARGNLLLQLGPEPEMWMRLSKGHRADVKHASPFDVWESFDAYAELHRRVFPGARGERTYQIMKEIVDAGYGFSLHAVRGGHPAAAALFFMLQPGSYYASAPRCRCADHENERGAAHRLVWEGMKRLHASGIQWLDLGPMPGPGAPDKEFGIAAFKKHFGATVR